MSNLVRSCPADPRPAGSRYWFLFLVRRRAEDLHRAEHRIHQPTQLGCLLKVFPHVVLNRLQPTGIRFHLDEESSLGRVARMLSSSRGPVVRRGFSKSRRHRESGGHHWEERSRWRRAADTAAVFFSPVAELADNLKFAGTRTGMSRGHDDQFPFGGQFKVEVGMLSAEGSEFLVAHGMNRQGRGKKRLIDQKRQGLSLVEMAMRDEVDLDRARDRQCRLISGCGEAAGQGRKCGRLP